MANSHRVFISYSQKDGDIAASLASKLEDAGVRCFLADRSILAAAEWEPRLREAIFSAEHVLLLMTPRSKESLWVAAEAGAAWVLQKPLIPVLMFVEPSELFGPIQKYQARVAETPAQIERLVEELKVSLELEAPIPNHADGQLPACTPSAESFTSSRGWEGLLKVGEWARDPDNGSILGEGMYRYLLSDRIYGAVPFTIRCRLTFLELRPESGVDAVNAGIVLGWRVPRQARQYYHLLFTGTQLLLEKIGARDGTEYLDYAHVNDGVTFQLEPNRPYDLAISVAGNVIKVQCDGRPTYHVAIDEAVPAGRVGLRPWRSRLKCERFDVADGS